MKTSLFATLFSSLFSFCPCLAQAQATTADRAPSANAKQASLQELLAQKSLATCDSFQDQLRDQDNKILENIGSVDNLNLSDKVGIKNSRKQFGNSIDLRHRLVLRVDTCERLHSQILNYYNNQDVSAFFQERISNLVIADLGVGRLKSPESPAVLSFLFDLKIELKSSSLSGVAVWEFIAQRLKEYNFGDGHSDEMVNRVLESSYTDDVQSQTATGVSLEAAGDYVDAKLSDHSIPAGTSKVFRSDSHGQLELRP